jgi:hypothetical protein
LCTAAANVLVQNPEDFAFDPVRRQAGPPDERKDKSAGWGLGLDDCGDELLNPLFLAGLVDGERMRRTGIEPELLGHQRSRI